MIKNRDISVKFISHNLNSLHGNIVAASKSYQEASRIAADTVPLCKLEEGIYRLISKPYKAVLNAKWYDNFVKPMWESSKGISSEKFQKILIFGNTGKEIIRCSFYTVLTYFNQDIPYDKRLFLSIFHMGNGITSIALQLLIGLCAIKHQDKIIERVLKKFNLEKSVHEKTKLGLKFFIPILLTTVVVKRLVSPAISTPFAGIQKKKLMKLEQDQKTVPPSYLRNQAYDNTPECFYKFLNKDVLNTIRTKK